MQNETYTLSDATNIINAHGIISDISEMWEGVTPSDAVKQQATDTFKILTWRQIEFLYSEMVEAFDERKEDMEPANAALSAFEVCTKPKHAHDPITQCFHCSANLLKVGVVEVCEGGTAETPISFKNDVMVHETTLISNMESTHIICGKCKKEVDVDIEYLLDIYLNQHQGR